jgi:imidazolonepropionase-like amidohydrolase
MLPSPRTLRAAFAGVAAGLLVAFATIRPAGQSPAPATTALAGAHVLNAAANGWIDNRVVLVRDGRIAGLASPEAARGAGVTAVDLKGKYLVPGLISAHAHVSAVDGLKPAAYTPENTLRQLSVFARYGITSVFSLGDEQAPAFAARAAQSVATLNRARIFVAGDVITGRTPEEARQMVARVAALEPDIIKIRVDDNLGTTPKMAPDVYRAVIDEAHKRRLRVAVHIFYLEDAKAALRAGADMIAHSVRDLEIDEEFISLMRARAIPYCPTLTREVSTFVYESTPPFFSDPFFTREADAAVVARLREPARQSAMAASAAAQRYKAGLAIAQHNLKKAADAGLLIVMGTDSGATADRFEGYFEHLEMQMMSDAGLSPARVLRAATVDAAIAVGAPSIGAIAEGRWADFVVLDRNPLDSIRNLQSISAVYVAGNVVKR